MAKRKTLTNEEIEKRKEHAKLLYVSQGITNQKELSEKTGISTTTINKWINADDSAWKRLRESKLLTKENELRRTYMQYTELNDRIESRPKGERFPDSKEADILSKIASAIRQLETETSIAEAVEVLTKFVNFIKSDDYEKAKEITALADSFIKSLIK